MGMGLSAFSLVEAVNGLLNPHLLGEDDTLESRRVTDSRTLEPDGLHIVRAHLPVVEVTESEGKAAFWVGHIHLFATARGRAGRNTGDDDQAFLAGSDTVQTFRGRGA